MANLRNNDAEIARLRALPYREGYLTSTWWKRRSYARLLKAKGKCERCEKVVSKADVHHVHYDRLGAERDSDLEVLCRTCHQTHHFDESQKHNVGAYLNLARETVRLDHPASFTEFKEAFRERCQGMHLPIDHRFDDAMTIVWDKKQVSLASAARRQEVEAVLTTEPELPPATHQEAASLLRRLGLKVPVKSMPTMFAGGTGVAAIRERAAARLKGEQCPQCRLVGSAIPSRVKPGWLSCTGCHHRWPLVLEQSL
jgi:HNH endonuclease